MSELVVDLAGSQERPFTEIPFANDSVVFEVSTIFVPLTSSTHLQRSDLDVACDIAQLHREETSARCWLVDSARTGALRLWRQMLEKRSDVNAFSKQAIRELQSFYVQEASERDKVGTRAEWRARMKLYAVHEVALDHVIHRSKVSVLERGTRGGLEREERTAWSLIGQHHMSDLESCVRQQHHHEEEQRWRHINDVQRPISIAIAALPLHERRLRAQIAAEWRHEVLPLGEGWVSMLLQAHRKFTDDRDELCDRFVFARKLTQDAEFEDFSSLCREEVCQRHSASCVDDVVLLEFASRRALVATWALLKSVALLEKELSAAACLIDQAEEFEWRTLGSAASLNEQEATARWVTAMPLMAESFAQLHGEWAERIAGALHVAFLDVTFRMSQCCHGEQRHRLVEEATEHLARQELIGRCQHQQQYWAEASAIAGGRVSGTLLIEDRGRRRVHWEQEAYEFELLVGDEAVDVLDVLRDEESVAWEALQRQVTLIVDIHCIDTYERKQRFELEEAFLRDSIEVYGCTGQRLLWHACTLTALTVQETQARAALAAVQVLAAQLTYTSGVLEPLERLDVEHHRRTSVVTAVWGLQRWGVEADEDVERLVLCEQYQRHEHAAFISRQRLATFLQCVEAVMEPTSRQIIELHYAAAASLSQWEAATNVMARLDPLWEAERRLRRQVEVTERNQRLDLHRHIASVVARCWGSADDAAGEHDGPNATSHAPAALNTTQMKLYHQWIMESAASPLPPSAPVSASPAAKGSGRGASSSKGPRPTSSLLLGAIAHSSPAVGSATRRSLF